MKKILAVTTALLFAVGGAAVVAPAANAAVDASAQSVVVAKQSAKDKKYLRDVRADAPSLRGVTSATLIKSGKQTCATLKSGASAYDVIGAGMDAGLDDDEIVSLIANAVYYYCPTQSYKFAD